MLMDMNLFNNLNLNGAKLNWVYQWISFEFCVEDFSVLVGEENGAAKIIHVIHQGQTYTDPIYLANWQAMTNKFFNIIKAVATTKEKPLSDIQLDGAELKWVGQGFSFEYSLQDFIVNAFKYDNTVKLEHVTYQGQTYSDSAYLANWQTLTEYIVNTIMPITQVQKSSPISPSLPPMPVIEHLFPQMSVNEPGYDNVFKKLGGKSQLGLNNNLQQIAIAASVILVLAVAAWWLLLRDNGEVMATPAPPNYYYNYGTYEPNHNNEINEQCIIDVPQTEYGIALEIALDFILTEGFNRCEVGENGYLLIFGMSLVQLQMLLNEHLAEFEFSDDAVSYVFNELEDRVNFHNQAKWLARWLYETEEERNVEGVRERLTNYWFTHSQIEYAIYSLIADDSHVMTDANSDYAAALEFALDFIVNGNGRYVDKSGIDLAFWEEVWAERAEEESYMLFISMSYIKMHMLINEELLEFGFSDNVIRYVMNELEERINFHNQAMWHAEWIWINENVRDFDIIRKRFTSYGYTHSQIESAIYFLNNQMNE